MGKRLPRPVVGALRRHERVVERRKILRRTGARNRASSGTIERTLMMEAADEGGMNGVEKSSAQETMSGFAARAITSIDGSVSRAGGSSQCLMA